MAAATSNVLDEMTRRIVEQFEPEQVILFGSRARGSASSDSDYDLLVVFEHCTDRRKAAIAVGAALADIPASKDIIIATLPELEGEPCAASSIVKAALRDGRLIYARG